MVSLYKRCFAALWISTSLSSEEAAAEVADAEVAKQHTDLWERTRTELFAIWIRNKSNN